MGEFFLIVGVLFVSCFCLLVAINIFGYFVDKFQEGQNAIKKLAEVMVNRDWYEDQLNKTKETMAVMTEVDPEIDDEDDSDCEEEDDDTITQIGEELNRLESELKAKDVELDDLRVSYEISRKNCNHMIARAVELRDDCAKAHADAKAKAAELQAIINARDVELHDIKASMALKEISIHGMDEKIRKLQDDHVAEKTKLWIEFHSREDALKKQVGEVEKKLEDAERVVQNLAASIRKCQVGVGQIQNELIMAVDDIATKGTFGWSPINCSGSIVIPTLDPKANQPPKPEGQW